jgi:hypothetical protein
VTDAAGARTIDYIFAGIDSWTLDGTPMSGAFTLTVVSDISTVTGTIFDQGIFNTGVGTFVLGATTATLTGTGGIENQTFPGVIFLGQPHGPGDVLFLINSAFATYDLTTAFPSTGGTVGFGGATFSTSAGDLVMAHPESLFFEATFPATTIPEPSTWAMMLAGLAGLGFLGYRQARRAKPQAV